jgi:hypothetical protein
LRLKPCVSTTVVARRKSNGKQPVLSARNY